MKFNLLMVLFVVIVGIIAAFQPTADLYDESDNSHTWGYWKHTWERVVSRPPNKTATIPIINGNYPGDPNVLQGIYRLAVAIRDTTKFNAEYLGG